MNYLCKLCKKNKQAEPSHYTNKQCPRNCSYAKEIRNQEKKQITNKIISQSKRDKREWKKFLKKTKPKTYYK